MNRIWKMSLLITALILLDQFSKGAIQSRFSIGETLPIIDGFFNFTYVTNSGAAFGMGADSHNFIRGIFFFFVPVLACFWLMYLMWEQRNKFFSLCLAYSLILAGAIGNLIDRFTLNYVVDFLDFYYGGFHFWTFNIADSCITIGAFFLIWGFYQESRLHKKEEAV